MSFKERVNADNLNVFLDTSFFGETRTVVFDGEEYEDISCVISQMKEQAKTTKASSNGGESGGRKE